MFESNTDNDIMNLLIMEGMKGDEQFRKAAIEAEMASKNGEMNPICLRWLYDFAVREGGEMLDRYVTEMLSGQYTNVNWFEVEQMCYALLKQDAERGATCLSLLYDADIGQLPNAAKMKQYMKMAADLGNAGAAVALAEYYLRDKDEEHSLEEIRGLLERGVQSKRRIEHSYPLLVKVCDAMEDYAASIRYLKRWHKEEPKNPDPSLDLGMRYIDGCGVSTHYETALKYLEKSAYAGNENAMYLVAEMNWRGDGCRRNYKRALDYYQRAVDAGSALACSALGRIYYNGNHVKDDVKKAASYYQLGVERNDAESCVRLAHIYYMGEAGEENHQRAAELLDLARDYSDETDSHTLEFITILEQIAVRRGWPISTRNVGVVSDADMRAAIDADDFTVVTQKTLQGVKSMPDDKQVLKNAWYLMSIRALDEDTRRAYIEVLRHQAQEHKKVSLMVGDMYYNGIGAKRNMASALNFYRRAIEGDYAEAAYLRLILGLHEENLRGGREAVPHLYQEAMEKLPDSATLQYMGALLHRVGLYVEANLEKSNAMWARAQELGRKWDLEEDIKSWQVGRVGLRNLLRVPPVYEL